VSVRFRKSRDYLSAAEVGGAFLTHKNKFAGMKSQGYHPLRKLSAVHRGIRFAVLQDFSVTYKLGLSLVIMVASIYLRHWIDLAIIAMATASVLAAELFNTAVEATCDYIQPRHDEQIGMIKDVAAAAAGVCILVWAFILIYEYYAVVVVIIS
jgi:diacylglycerol kinase (ATP)